MCLAECLSANVSITEGHKLGVLMSRGVLHHSSGKREQGGCRAGLLRATGCSSAVCLSL